MTITVNIGHITININQDNSPEVQRLAVGAQELNSSLDKLQKDIECTVTANLKPHIEHAKLQAKLVKQQSYKHRLAAKIRTMFGDDIANSFLAGALQ